VLQVPSTTRGFVAGIGQVTSALLLCLVSLLVATALRRFIANADNDLWLTVVGPYAGAVLFGLTDRGDDRLRADALAHQATIYRTATTRFDAERAEKLLDAALKIARGLDDRVLIAQLQRDQMHIHLFRGHVKQAIAAGEESLAAPPRSDRRNRSCTRRTTSCAPTVKPACWKGGAWQRSGPPR